MAATVGESGKLRLFAFVVARGGALTGGGKYCPEPLLEGQAAPPVPPAPVPVPHNRLVEQKLMFDFLRELCLSNVF